MFRYSYINSIGRKEINQDALLLQTARYQQHEILFAAVCDGIGGLTGGEIASSFVISQVAEWFSTEYANTLKEGKSILAIRQSLDDCLQRLNSEINTGTPNGTEMGTTFTSLLIDTVNQVTLTGHVGDTRLYKIFPDSVEIVTSDHSVIAEEVRRGIITEEEALHDSRQNQITNCIGAGETDRMYDYIIQKPCTECTYLLCSDGFRKMITKEEIRTFLSPENNPDNDAIHEHLSALLDMNLQRNENDNITALAVRYIKESDT
ncbi:MAG: serine/threonine-protein phosphatase [Ruminococcus sp.]|nr:serine/threonine-protein phosphatase [Ruminococcus sp.]